ncbi:mechanosensitive ion channel family protein [Georgenia sp. H159]|uniref:mechanosensitive ion channel family protein n=1 Tax=Georgenia sp. H159 TaxID=3076115 RepID=UPI002D7669F3|nr:mechanosensitive ion channel domain-containing protein [Georgenia sp. H159]
MEPHTVEVDWGLPPIEPAQVGVGLLVLVGAYVLGRLLEAALRPYWRWRGRSPSFATVFAMLTKWLVTLIGFGAGLTIAFPSVRPVDVLGGLGVISIAAGIAFQQVLGNLFAGVILLVREPFRGGDQVAIGDVRGTVVSINLRETIVRTFDGRRVVIPNSVVHDGVVTVQTGYEQVRTAVVVGVAYDADLAQAREVALAAMHGLSAVAEDPAPEALVTQLGPSTIDLELRFWSGARQLETLEARSQVISAVVGAYTEHGIAMPAEIRVLEASAGLEQALAHAGEGTPRRGRRRTTR